MYQRNSPCVPNNYYPSNNMQYNNNLAGSFPNIAY